MIIIISIISKKEKENTLSKSNNVLFKQLKNAPPALVLCLPTTKISTSVSCYIIALTSASLSRIPVTSTSTITDVSISPFINKAIVLSLRA